MKVGRAKRMACAVCIAAALAAMAALVGCATGSDGQMSSAGGYAKTQWYSVHGGTESNISFQDEASWNGVVNEEGVSGSWSDDNGKLVLSGGRETLFMNPANLSGHEALVLQDGEGNETPFFKSEDDAVDHEKSAIKSILASQKWYSGEFIADSGERFITFNEDGTWSTESTKEEDPRWENFGALVEDGASGKFSVSSVKETGNLLESFGKADYEGVLDFEGIGSFEFSIEIEGSSKDGRDVLRIASDSFRNVDNTTGMIAGVGVAR